MGHYNFDEVIDRKGTGALKTDALIKNAEPSDVIPMWIADMDFRTADSIVEVIKKSAEYGVFGYTDFDIKYKNAVTEWFKNYYDFNFSIDDIVSTPGVVFALAMAVRAYTNENDNIIIFSPVYNPFREVIKFNGRNIIESNLIINNNRYEIDFADFENKIKQNNVKMLIFCNPHNPGSRAWTKMELEKLVRICIDNRVFIVSDEIHSDFVWTGSKHFNLANISFPGINEMLITCTAPSKTFNIAGIQDSNIIIKDAVIRQKYVDEINKTGYHRISQMAQIATIAAYSEGREWLDEVKEYIYNNILYVKEYFETNLPAIKVFMPEGTYLLWLDFRKYKLDDKELNNKMIYEAKVHLDNGLKFGTAGNGFMRMNVATSRKIVEKALERIKNSFK